MDQTVFHKENKTPAGLDPVERLHELRAIAFSALAFGDIGVDLWRCFAELKSLSVPAEKRAEHLEALIGICVAARIRPSRTTRMINELRQMRDAQGQKQKFRGFEALFRRSLGDLRLTNHEYRTENFGDLDHAPVWETVGRHIATLHERGYPVFLNSGTLLGVVRDRKLIDHDDDIDLAVIMKAGSAQEAAAEWKTLTADIHALGLVDEASFNDPAIIKLLPIGNVQVDLFPGWIEGENVFVFPHTSGQLSRGDVLPLKPCPVTGNPIPAEAEEMLALNYGDGWREPDPYFKFPWSTARRTFAPFLKALT